MHTATRARHDHTVPDGSDEAAKEASIASSASCHGHIRDALSSGGASLPLLPCFPAPHAARTAESGVFGLFGVDGSRRAATVPPARRWTGSASGSARQSRSAAREARAPRAVGDLGKRGERAAYIDKHL